MKKNKVALITGVNGQDGSYLAEYLIANGYRVIGTSHQSNPILRLPSLAKAIEIRHLELNDADGIKTLIKEAHPDEIYNLGARSSSSQLFDDPLATANINGLAATRFLEAIRLISPKTRFCQALSSELFAGTIDSPQDEHTPIRPINAYGAAKAYAAHMVNAYRSQYGLFACNAILYNHESPRRELNYVTRKITNTVAKIALGQASELVLGSLDSQRDWGFAGDYVYAMWLMLQQSNPTDYVIATGIAHTVRDFCETAFSHVGLDYHNFVRVDPNYIRRQEMVTLVGNPAKIKQIGWKTTVDFQKLVHMMVDADLRSLNSN